MRITLALATAGALLAGACSTSDPEQAQTPAPPTPTGWGYGPTAAPVSSPEAATFTGLSVRADKTSPEPTDIDIVELKFTGGTPGCDVRYIDPPVLDVVSGEPVEVQGEAFLQVNCQPVTSLTTESNNYNSPDTKNVTEVIKTGYDGSTLTWTIGLQRRAPLGVGTLGGEPPGPTSGVIIGIVQ